MRLKIWLAGGLLCLLNTAILADKPRIITLAPHLAEIVFALNAGEQIIATIEHTDYPEAARAIRTIGNSNSINIETIIGLKPDLILAWRTGNPELQLQRLADLGVAIYYSKPESIDDLSREIREIGELIGQSSRAKALATKLNDEIANIESHYADKQPVAVFYQIWHQPLRSVGNDPWLNGLLARCAGRNIFTHLNQAFPLVSYEAVLAKNPDIIIIPSKGNITEQAANWQQWTQINAIRNQQIEQLNPDWIHRFTPRITQGLEQLCQAVNKARIINEK